MKEVEKDKSWMEEDVGEEERMEGKEKEGWRRKGKGGKLQKQLKKGKGKKG